MAGRWRARFAQGGHRSTGIDVGADEVRVVVLSRRGRGAEVCVEAGSSEAEGAAARLAGTFRDGHAGLALFDDGDGAFTAVVPGEALGVARVVRVDPVAVTLATADGAYRVTLDDGRRP
ncbi:hypothetical protein Bcep18194_A3487 [Burkholderia lata]|uniref:Uncharacterized protein n=1 Tax=Burkholderia lata (strain ATCC 17760 / DSM 23089 / LMG 22485 / NCIMB 9086 / R18194 / 383) TaxID=482957 RepID=Q39KC7_BURL3|nr:hypothetical protein Bcep18194_A3487 [Burkholderia lata]